MSVYVETSGFELFLRTLSPKASNAGSRIDNRKPATWPLVFEGCVYLYVLLLAEQTGNTSGESAPSPSQACGWREDIGEICHPWEGGSCGWGLPLPGLECHGQKGGVTLLTTFQSPTLCLKPATNLSDTEDTLHRVVILPYWILGSLQRNTDLCMTTL